MQQVFVRSGLHKLVDGLQQLCQPTPRDPAPKIVGLIEELRLDLVEGGLWHCPKARNVHLSARLTPEGLRAEEGTSTSTRSDRLTLSLPDCFFALSAVPVLIRTTDSRERDCSSSNKKKWLVTPQSMSPTGMVLSAVEFYIVFCVLCNDLDLNSGHEFIMEIIPCIIIMIIGFALQPVSFSLQSWQRTHPNSSTLDGYYPPSRLFSNFIILIGRTWSQDSETLA